MQLDETVNKRMRIVEGNIQRSGLFENKSDSRTIMKMLLIESKPWSNVDVEYTVEYFFFFFFFLVLKSVESQTPRFKTNSTKSTARKSNLNKKRQDISSSFY